VVEPWRRALAVDRARQHDDSLRPDRGEPHRRSRRRLADLQLVGVRELRRQGQRDRLFVRARGRRGSRRRRAARAKPRRGPRDGEISVGHPLWQCGAAGIARRSGPDDLDVRGGVRLRRRPRRAGLRQLAARVTDGGERVGGEAGSVLDLPIRPASRCAPTGGVAGC
jgi:hypothetical protein